jgi:hypothetical protein
MLASEKHFNFGECKKIHGHNGCFNAFFKGDDVRSCVE